MSVDTSIKSINPPMENGDYESDVLDSSDDDDADHSLDVDSAALNLDDEDYENFLRSCFCDDDGAKSFCSLTDEEDEEEYRPQHIDSNDDDDDDDDGDDGFIKVARKELVDLVDGCWQTIAGEPLQFPPSGFESSTQSKRGVKRSRNNIDDNHSVSGIEDIGEGDQNSNLTGSIYSRPNSVATQLKKSQQPASLSYTSKKDQPHTVSQSLISNLVRQIFSGEKPSAVCVDGMPVDAIRKLVARQMGMASQLLVQMLLSSEDRSGCFSSSYTSLMELSNHRESALKKAALLQMNMKNLRAAAFQRIAQLSQHAGTSGSRPDGLQSNDEKERSDPDSSPAEMRLTRAVAERQSKALGSLVRSSSLFDVPMLADITELFGAIDLSRREMKAEIASAAAAVEVPTLSMLLAAGNVKKRMFASTVTADANALFRSRSDVLSALKTQMQRIAISSTSTQAVSILTKMNVWSCLTPTPYFPLGEDVMKGTDPSSLLGRSLFTPAEDDLLLRGILKYGENDSWGEIRRQFLPSKEEQLLQFRFRQMTSVSAKEASKFKRYAALEKNSKGREKWSHEEDLDLLKGYQIYGDKWPLIGVYFFPHRCHKELKARWVAIQKHWERAFSGSLLPITFQTHLPPSSKMLLHFLNENNHVDQNSPLKSPDGNNQTRMLQSGNTDVTNKSNSSSNHVKENISIKNGNDNGNEFKNLNDSDHNQDHKNSYDCDCEADDAEEDVLDDSDDEGGERIKDSDWHLGLLTSRQPASSRWSREVPSSASTHSNDKSNFSSSKKYDSGDSGEYRNIGSNNYERKMEIDGVSNSNNHYDGRRYSVNTNTDDNEISGRSQPKMLANQTKQQQPHERQEVSSIRTGSSSSSRNYINNNNNDNNNNNNNDNNNSRIHSSIIGESKTSNKRNNYNNNMNTTSEKKINNRRSVPLKENPFYNPPSSRPPPHPPNPNPNPYSNPNLPSPQAPIVTSSMGSNLCLIPPLETETIPYEFSEFTNFSNISLMLQNAKAILDKNDFVSEGIDKLTTGKRLNDDLDPQVLVQRTVASSFTTAAGNSSSNGLPLSTGFSSSYSVGTVGSNKSESVKSMVGTNKGIGLFAAVMGESNKTRK